MTIEELLAVLRLDSDVIAKGAVRRGLHRRWDRQLENVDFLRVLVALLAELVLRTLDLDGRACGKLGRRKPLRVLGKGKRLRLRDRKRHHPVGAKVQVPHEVAAGDGDVVVVDREEHAVARLAVLRARHELAHLARTVLRRTAGVLETSVRPELVVRFARIAQRARADRGECALPERALVKERVMRVAGKRNRVRVA